MDRNKYAILVLAAGNSTRLGRPKQLIKWKQSTLLNHTIDQASKLDNLDIYVALGGNKSIILPSVSSEAIILDISNWDEGMGSTIASSMNQIDTDNYDGIILSVCDQPFISYEIFNELIYSFENNNSSIIVSKYKNGSGPPSLFAKNQYSKLVELRGESGAKKVVNNNMENVTFISFINGDIDIDTEDDLKKYLNSSV